MLKKIPFPNCGEVLSRFELSEEAAEFINPEMPVEEGLLALARGETFIDLIGFVSHALPAREAICWAAAVGDEMNGIDASILKQVRAWVSEPQESRRLACRALAKKIGTDTASGWLCMAVDWNGSGSIAAPEDPQVAPPPFLYAKALIGAVGLLAPLDEAKREAYFKLMHEKALAVSGGAWPGVVH